MPDQVTTRERTRTIGEMFSRLVPHYDRMNRLMTAGGTAAGGRWRSRFRNRGTRWCSISERAPAI